MQTQLNLMQAIVPIPTEKSKGMSGFLILVSGEACPPAIPAPFSLGEDISNNQVGLPFCALNVLRVCVCSTDQLGYNRQKTFNSTTPTCM